MAKVKRKEYLNVAERLMLELLVSYYKESGEFPNSSQIKRTCTMARNAAYEMIMSDVHRRVQSPKGLWDIQNHQDFKAGLADTIKELEQDVHDFWLRRKHP